MELTVKFENVESVKNLAPLSGKCGEMVRIVMENGNSVVIPAAWIVEGK